MRSCITKVLEGSTEKKRAFLETIELPIGLNAHHGLEMSDDEWRNVSIVHLISGYGVNRLPSFLADTVKANLRYCDLNGCLIGSLSYT